MRRRAAAVAVAGLAAMALAGCGTAVSPAAAVRSWSSAGEFPQSVTTLLRDSADVHHEISFHRPPLNVKTACDELFNDANYENTDELTTPDHQLTNLLADAYDAFIQAADRCANDPGSPTVLAAVDRERHRAVGLLVAGVLREEDVAGRSLGIRGIP
jgi:hypothetical protein